MESPALGERHELAGQQGGWSGIGRIVVAIAVPIVAFIVL